MKKLEIFKELEKLDLPKDKYIVISGASLVCQDIIDETDDIDLTCSKEYYCFQFQHFLSLFPY